MRFHLSSFESQDEYEVVLDIIDENKTNIAKINCKINFIWSYYTHYLDLVNKTEKKINHYNITTSKSNKILEILNGMFIFNFNL